MKQGIRHMILGVSAALLALPAGSALAATQPVQDVDIPKIEALVPEFSEKTERRVQVERVAQRGQISASQAKSAAQSRYPGAKFVNIKKSGNDTYRVRLQQKNGRIIDVYVDARTGRVKN